MDTIAAIIVTYNRKELLKKCLDSLLYQTIKLDSIIVVDNSSTDGTKEFLIDHNYLDNKTLDYIRLNENLGGAGGFYEGIKRGVDRGFDWLWLMDDDGRPSDQFTLEKILIQKNELTNKYKNKQLILNSLVICDNKNLSFGLDSITSVDQLSNTKTENLFFDSINPFNGTLISKEVVDIIGLPRKDFFIKGDEREYILRAKSKNVRVMTVTNSFFYHPKLDKRVITFLGKKLVVTDEAPWKEYYRTRNSIYINKQYKTDKSLFKFILLRLLTVLFSKNNKKNNVIMVLKGINDGLFNRFGKRVSP